jgi:hypothetical protein
VAAALLLAAALPAQSKTLLFLSRYNSTSLDSAAGVLSNARPFDIFAVTPGAGATAFPWLPAAGISATIGDPNNDGKIPEFNGLPAASFGIGGLLVKAADKKKGDPRLVYWTVRVPALNPPKIDVFHQGKVKTVRTGDFVRLTENGEAEYFITQELIMKAAGPQTGNWVPGAIAMCQDANGDIYYAPAHGVAANVTIAGGHWVNKPTKTWCNDGAIVRIPKAAITYDAKGNVKDITQSSAIVAANETGAGPGSIASVRTMCINSGAKDSIGKATSVTFQMVGLDIDPNGGTWVGWFEPQVKYPNLIFTFENISTTCCGGPWGSWMGTVFSTAPVSSTSTALGSIAKINGTLMGQTSGNATGAWTGLKQFSGSTTNAPIIRGLAVIDAGFKSTAPYGNATKQVANDGVIDLKKDPTVRIGVQGPVANFPTTMAIGFGIAKGGKPKSLDFTGIFGGYASVHILQGPIIALLPLGASSAKGQVLFNVSVPNDPKLVGINFILQSLSVNLGMPLLTNPVVIEVR